MKIKSKKELITPAIIFVFCFLIFSLIYYNKTKQNNAWELAKTTNTNESYQEYLKSYPKGIYASKANIIVDEMLWKETVNANTFMGYKIYREKFPQGIHFSIADSLWQEVLWKEALSCNKDSCYQNYLTKFPKGKYAKNAQFGIGKYLIQDEGVGCFKFSDKISKINIYQCFIIKKRKLRNIADIEFENYLVSEKGENLLNIPFYNKDEMSSIEIISSKFHTKKNIGINSTIEEFASAYSDFDINICTGAEGGGTHISVVTKEINGYFYLNLKDYIGDSKNLFTDGEAVHLQLSDLKRKAKIKSIEVFQRDPKIATPVVQNSNIASNQSTKITQTSSTSKQSTRTRGYERSNRDYFTCVSAVHEFLSSHTFVSSEGSRLSYSVGNLSINYGKGTQRFTNIEVRIHNQNEAVVSAMDVGSGRTLRIYVSSLYGSIVDMNDNSTSFQATN